LEAEIIASTKLMFCIAMNLIIASLLFGGFSLRPVKAQAPYLRWVATYPLPNVINHNPEGKLNVQVDICKLMNDGSSTYDWYFYSNIPLGHEGMRIETVPGTVSYGSGWETAQTYVKYIVEGFGGQLSDHDPTSANGFNNPSATVGITISNMPSVTFTQTFGYPIPYINVMDYSDSSAKRAYWISDFNEQNDPPGATSDTTYVARPAFVVRSLQNAWCLASAWYKVEWGDHWPVWHYAGYESSTLYLSAHYQGDT